MREAPLPLHTSNSAKISAETKKTHVVLDIDGTLVSVLSRFNNHGEELPFANQLKEVFEHYPHFSELENSNLIIKALFHHMVFPGTYELIQWLSDMQHIHLSFFSAGTEDRNELLVDTLLTRAFADCRNEVRVFSRPHLTPGECFQSRPGLFSTEYLLVKNLRTITAENLDYAILVDDNPLYAHPSQTKSFLHLPGSDFKLFDGILKQNALGTTLNDLLLANKIFYLAGMLNRIIHPNETQTPADRLQQLTFSTMDTANQVKLNRGFTSSDIGIYREGLKVLKERNLALTFFMAPALEAYFANQQTPASQAASNHSSASPRP